MRLWHKDLIPVLPQKQLCGQWRECCAIAHNISSKGYPNHILVNKIMYFSLDHFVTYSKIVFNEMTKRGYKANWSNFEKYMPRMRLFDRIEHDHSKPYSDIPYYFLFQHWHNKKYLKQCYYNLEEKYDCGAINPAEMILIENEYERSMGS